MHVVIHTKDEDENLPVYRRTIKEAMTRLNLLPAWDEISYATGDEAGRRRERILPRITMDGTVIWSEKYKDNLSVDYLVGKMQKRPRLKFVRILQKNLSFMLALFIAFCPKCPVCWAAWLSGFGLVSASAIPYRPWYLYLSVALMILNIVALYLLNKKHDFKPLLINIAGASLIIVNRFTVNQSALMIIGGILLLAGAAWSSMPVWMKRNKLRIGAA
jgi:hypothetical protein